MSLKSLIAVRIAEKRFSEETLLSNRHIFEQTRVTSGDNHVIEFFHDPSDPYSQLLQKVIPMFQETYNIQLVTHLVGPPSESASPERMKLTHYAKMDTMRLAKKAGIEFEIEDHAPASNTSNADARREKLGHYLGGTLYYGGEWYWGLDRLQYLEARLNDLGLYQGTREFKYIYEQPDVPVSSGDTRAELHWYLSYRSPYSAICRGRVKDLADAYGAQLKIRFVLPMVMRGLPIPSTKKRYIPLDTAREARRLGIPFGRVLDPIGKPVEMGYSLIPWARQCGRDYEFTHSWLSGVWAEGLNAGSTKGLKKIAKRAGLDWNEAKGVLGNDDWRMEAETNRLEMMDLGVWGVPSFRVDETVTWGQDRLWVVEHALQKLSKKIV